MRRNGFVVFSIFFSVIAITITCNFLLFLHFFELDSQVLIKAAPITFFNCLIWTMIYCIVDGVRRYYTINLPVKRIQKALDEVMKGNYHTRIDYVIKEDSKNELDIIIKSINTMIEELSSVETLQSDFINNVSHEFKTPLSVIHNYAVLLQTKDINASHIQQYTQVINEQTQKLANLVSHILRLNQLENKKIYPNTKTYNLSRQLIECLLNYETIWEDKQIIIEPEIEEDVYIEADQDLIAIVWDNLLSNALKFTPNEGHIRISLKRLENMAIVEIEDSGKGIEASKGKHIFEKFYQTDTSHASKGNGLGLALVKRVIDICKGEISVISEVNKGSIFCVKLECKEENNG